jgi:CubicO group peptidase (beta-lactamase class C family)
MNFGPVDRQFEEAVEKETFPGCVILVSRRDRVVYFRAFGYRSLDPERTTMEEDTIFDLSSLTKPIATATAFMLLVQERKVRLNDRLNRFFHNFGVYGKTHVTFRHLLNHSSGLPQWKPYYREILEIEKMGRVNFMAQMGAKQYVYEQIHREKISFPPGTRSLYSDLGFMLIGQLIEELTGVTLDRFCHERIFKPLGLRSTAFIDLVLLRTRRLEPVREMIAPTERCPWRGRVLCGEVQDDNAYAMGGVSGHSGLFSCASDLNHFIIQLKECLRGKKDFLMSELVKELWTQDETVPGSTWALGWDTPSPSGSSSGQYFSPRSVGHLGYTGTSIWIDLGKDIHVILLTNRVHPTRENERIREFRPIVHDLIMQAVLN